ncbi:MAG: mechanosensitive ion channel family protein [Myxococcales bacterium]|nr:mechanosensitive ion channel family protein [Myxococcales bacterium]
MFAPRFETLAVALCLLAAPALAQADGGLSTVDRVLNDLVVPLRPPPAEPVADAGLEPASELLTDAGSVAALSPVTPDAGRVAALPITPDAGSAAGLLTAPPDAGAAPAEELTVVVHDTVTPLVFRRALAEKPARVRAREATTAFTSAIELPALPGAPMAQVVVVGAEARVFIKGRVVTTFTDADRLASGAVSLTAWAAELETRLTGFVEDAERRYAYREFAFHLFFAVFVVLMAGLTLRALNRAFARADTTIEDRAGSLKPLVVLGAELLSSDAVRSVLGTGLVVVRVVSLGGTVVVALAAVLAQFDRTRPLLSRLGSSIGRPVLQGLEGTLASFPGLVLAAVLLVLLRAALRFVTLLFDGVATGRVKHGWIEPRRAPVARAVLSWLVVAVSLPLLVAAAFGRFGSPFESLALGVGAVVMVGALPTVVGAVVGAWLSWNGVVQVGSWVQVGSHVGEVVEHSLTELVLVPRDGGSVVVPMLLLAVTPVRRLSGPPAQAFEVRVRREGSTAQLMERLLAVARAVDERGDVEVVEVDAESALVRLTVPAGDAQRRALLSRALLDAVDAGHLTLAQGTARNRLGAD